MADSIRFIGSGDSFGSGGRFQTCILASLGDKRFLIDCGASSLIAMRAQGIDPNSIDAIVLTHLHGDHCAGVPFLLLDAMLGSKRQAPLVVAGPAGSRERMADLGEALFPGSHVLRPKFPYEYIELVPGQPNIVGGAAVRVFPALHTPETTPTMVRLEYAGKTVAYTGDTEWTDTIVALADGADVLVSECGFYEKAVRTHMNYRVLKANLPKLRMKCLVLTHMSSEMLAHSGEIPELLAADGLVIAL